MLVNGSVVHSGGADALMYLWRHKSKHWGWSINPFGLYIYYIIYIVYIIYYILYIVYYIFYIVYYIFYNIYFIFYHILYIIYYILYIVYYIFYIVYYIFYDIYFIFYHILNIIYYILYIVYYILYIIYYILHILYILNIYIYFQSSLFLVVFPFETFLNLDLFHVTCTTKTSRTFVFHSCSRSASSLKRVAGAAVRCGTRWTRQGNYPGDLIYPVIEGS